MWESMQDIDYFVMSSVICWLGDVFKIHEDIFVNCLTRSGRADLDNLALFFISLSLTPRINKQSCLIYSFFLFPSKIKTLWASTDVVQGKRRMQVIIPPPTIFLTLCLTPSWRPSYFLSHLLSNRCSIFTEKSSRGIRWRTGAKWSDRSTYLCCLRSPLASDNIRGWYILYMGIVHAGMEEKVGRGKVWKLKSRCCWWQSRRNNLKVWKQQMMR